MEGPYFDVQYKGAQNDKYITPAGVKEIEEYLSVKPGLVNYSLWLLKVKEH